MPSAALLVSVLGFSACSPSQAAKDASKPDPAITRAELEQEVRFLASDELGGRGPLSSGAERAAAHLAEALKAAGVEPAGDAGSYFQVTGLRRHVVASLPRLVFTDEAGAEVEARYGEDFEVRPRGPMHSTEKLPLRFFYDYNHSKMPLKGVPGEALYFSASRDDKLRILKAKGIETLTDWGLEFEVTPGDEGLQEGRHKDSFPPRYVSDFAPDGCELVVLRGPLRVNFDRRKYTHAQLLVDERVDENVDKSVVGRIRGAGTSEHPELAEEVVLLSANYDHDGQIPAKRRAEATDTLFNGADDNASGCAALLELAQAFAAGPKPARTLVFLFTASEELDDTGSRHYLAAPVEPLAKTVVALTLERLGRPDELAGGAGHVWMTGFGRSDLGRSWKTLELGIEPDPRVDQKFFQRSHAYSFAKAGLIAHSLSSYGLQPEIGMPEDQAETLDYAHLETVTRKVFAALQTLAGGKLKPVALEHERTSEGADDERASIRERLKGDGKGEAKGGGKGEAKSGAKNDGKGGAKDDDDDGDGKDEDDDEDDGG